MANQIIRRRNTHARHGKQHNAKFARIRDISPECANPNREPDETETGNNTESWPEVHYIQSVKGVNSIDIVEVNTEKYNSSAKFPVKLPRTLEKFECQRLTWTMYMGRQNYSKKSRNPVYSQNSEVTAPDFTGSKMDFTDYRIFPQYSRNISTRYSNSKNR